jgi:hypothetical protein
MQKAKLLLQVGIKKVKRLFAHSSRGERVLIENVPYYSQWESPELVESILNGAFDAKEDPNWKRSGAKDKEEYAAWSASGCGMACFKMILAHKTVKVIPLVELGKRCAEYGGYTLPVEKSVGLVYGPFATFASKEFAIKARPVLPLLKEEIIEELSKGSYVIASVSPHIRHTTSKPNTKGGHLVLVLGYDMNKRLFYFHNPSGFKQETQEYTSISFGDFKKFFGNKGIVIAG